MRFLFHDNVTISHYFVALYHRFLPNSYIEQTIIQPHNPLAVWVSTVCIHTSAVRC